MLIAMWTRYQTLKNEKQFALSAIQWEHYFPSPTPRVILNRSRGLRY
jgi:hypothetical protein